MIRIARSRLRLRRVFRLRLRARARRRTSVTRARLQLHTHGGIRPPRLRRRSPSTVTKGDTNKHIEFADANKIDKLADVQRAFNDGPVDGVKLDGFNIWQNKTARAKT